MGTAAKIWKDFKADLKAARFDETKTYKQLLAARGDRVNKDDWKWLIDHWRSPLGKERSEIGKANRAKMSGLHTSGSKSHARVSHEMCIENGYKPRRDEVYIKTHTHKDGIASEDVETKIKALQDAAEEHPEWTEKSISDGDIMSRVFGPERNGYVRSIGKGPTPGDLEMPGRNKYRSTKLQMAIEAHRQAELDKEDILKHFETMKSDSDRKLDALSQQVAKLSELLLANSQDGRLHISPQYASNSPIHENEHEDDENGEAQSENMIFGQTPNRYAASSQQGHEVAKFQGGKDVILYNVIGQHDIPVAKATILSTNQMTVVGGTPLGVQYCEVVVNLVLKRMAALPRPYGNMNVMADALGRSIAWPHHHMKEDRKPPPQQLASLNQGRNKGR